MKTFGGKVLFIDRSDINTDEIIPAKYLTEVKKDALKPHLLEDLKLDNFDPVKDINNVNVVITKSNFGCGSSREHAPWAFEVNDITVVIAQSYARIFRQNMFNCGMMAIELSKQVIDKLFTLANKKDVVCTINMKEKSLVFSCGSDTLTTESFILSEFDDALVKAGGWVEFADKNY